MEPMEFRVRIPNVGRELDDSYVAIYSAFPRRSYEFESARVQEGVARQSRIWLICGITSLDGKPVMECSYVPLREFELVDLFGNRHLVRSHDFRTAQAFVETFVRYKLDIGKNVTAHEFQERFE